MGFLEKIKNFFFGRKEEINKLKKQVEDLLKTSTEQQKQIGQLASRVKDQDTQIRTLKRKLQEKITEKIEDLVETEMYKTELYITTGKQSSNRSEDGGYFVIVTKEDNYDKSKNIPISKIKEILGLSRSDVILNINRGRESLEGDKVLSRKPYISINGKEQELFNSDNELWSFLEV